MEDKKPELKVFELTNGGEKDWVCAYTNIEALIVLFNTTGVSMSDLSEKDELTEVPKEKWAELYITNPEYNETDPEDWERKPFDEYMKDQISPDVIASTIY